MEPLLRTREDAAAGIRVGWELLHLLQLSVRSLEDTATRVVAAQLAGVIALWTQLYTFEETAPQALAWTAWGVVLVSIGLLGLRISPRRLSVFWQVLDAGWDSPWEAPLDEAQEAGIVESLATALRAQRDRLQRAVQTSVALGVLGLGLTALAYLVDKGLYAP
ncbi:MAG: hypothetical protein ACRDNI_12755 [Gaiellaceae bacterium]